LIHYNRLRALISRPRSFPAASTPGKNAGWWAENRWGPPCGRDNTRYMGNNGLLRAYLRGPARSASPSVSRPSDSVRLTVQAAAAQSRSFTSNGGQSGGRLPATWAKGGRALRACRPSGVRSRDAAAPPGPNSWPRGCSWAAWGAPPAPWTIRVTVQSAPEPCRLRRSRAARDSSDSGVTRAREHAVTRRVTTPGHGAVPRRRGVERGSGLYRKTRIVCPARRRVCADTRK
jgi:hypothetical protein